MGDQVVKNGGSVASHFLTNDGHVIHSVIGPVSAETLLTEAQWAIDAYERVSQCKSTQKKMLKMAYLHHDSISFPLNSSITNSPRHGGHALRRVHELYANRPFPRLEHVYQEVFEDILGQRISKAGPRLAEVSAKLAKAKQTGRPLLFVLYDRGGWANRGSVSPNASGVTRRLLNEYLVIEMPMQEGPAVSQLTGKPPFEVKGWQRPAFIVTNSDGDQLHSVAGWSELPLAEALGAGWLDAMEENPPNSVQLETIQRFLGTFSPRLSEQAEKLKLRLEELRASNR